MQFNYRLLFAKWSTTFVFWDFNISNFCLLTNEFLIKLKYSFNSTNNL